MPLHPFGTLCTTICAVLWAILDTEYAVLVIWAGMRLAIYVGKEIIMLAIETKFHGPTDHKGSRVTASVCEGTSTFGSRRRLTVGWDHALNSENNHHRAILSLIHKLGWIAKSGYGPWIVGGTEHGYVAVCDCGQYTRLIPTEDK